MSFSLDTPTALTLKSEAKALREARAECGEAITHGAALEEIAKKHGYRDWNTAKAALPDGVSAPTQTDHRSNRPVVPFQVGQRVKGLYLEQPFAGQIIGVQMSGNAQTFTITMQFDEPVNVTPTFMFEVLRHRVTATVDEHGFSTTKRGNGQPQMQIFQG